MKYKCKYMIIENTETKLLEKMLILLLKVIRRGDIKEKKTY